MQNFHDGGSIRAEPVRFFGIEFGYFPRTEHEFSRESVRRGGRDRAWPAGHGAVRTTPCTPRITDLASALVSSEPGGGSSRRPARDN